MKINRIFFLQKEKKNFKVILKNYVLLCLKSFDLFKVKLKNFFIFNKRLSTNSKFIYLIDKEDLKDYEINISKITQVYKLNKYFEPINKSSHICDALQIEISNGSKIYEISNLSLNFDLYIKSKTLKKIKNYNFDLDKKNLKHIIKTKKWLSIKIKLNKNVNLKKNNILIKFNKLDINQNHQYDQKYLSLRSLSKINLNLPKVIFIVFDGMTNYDLHNYIYNFSTKNIFKKLIQDSIYYKNSISGSTVTGSSLASLLTNSNMLQHGLYKYENHLYKAGQFPSKKLKFLAEEFLDNGYFTQGLTNFSRMRPHFGMNIGFQNYTNICTNKFHTSFYFEKMLEMLDAAENEKSFTFFHYIGGHPPFHPEINYNKKKFLRDNEEYFYYSNIAKSELFLEAIINQLKQKNLYNNSSIIITSDHGRGLGKFTRSNFHFYEDRLSVPLIYKPRGISKFKRKIISKRVSNFNEIYNLFQKYEKIQLNKKFIINNNDNIFWTTISSTYDNSNSFVFVGYDNLYKWIFKCAIDYKNYLDINIIDTPIAFKILKSNEIKEEKNYYNEIGEITKKKIKKSLFNFIKQSNIKRFKTETKNENIIFS